MVWVISDTHFGHENIYKFRSFIGGPRVREEFANAAEGDRAMIERWKAVVQPHDKVYHLGDVAMSAAGLMLVKELPGHKRLILGNHDKEPMQNYFHAGFEKVYGSRFLDGLFLTHIPISPFSIAKGRKNVHGHTHEKDVQMAEMQKVTRVGGHYGEEQWEEWERITLPDPRYLNVSVERTNYTPVRLESLR